MKKNTGICLSLLSFLFLNNTIAANFSTITDVANGLGNNYSMDMVTQADGKALVAGYYYDTHIKQNGSFVLRFTTAGELDSTFGTNGTNALTNLPGGEFSTLNQLKIFSDGKVLLVGQIPQNDKQKLLLARLNSNGTLDTDFGSNGYVLTQLTDVYPNVAKVTTQNDDSFFITLSNKKAITILKFNPDGSLSTNFADAGILISDISQSGGSSSSSMALQNDGKLVVVGSYLGDSFKASFIARYDSAGVLDNTFASNGFTIYRTSNTSTDSFRDVSIQNDGKIVVTGTSNDGPNNQSTMLLIRYLSNGNLDSSFATGGIVNSCPNYLQNECSGISVTVKSNGTLLVGNQLITEDTSMPLLYQFDTTGTLVNSYGVNGSKTFETAGSNYNFTANALDNSDNDVVSGYALIDGLFKVVLMSH